MVVLLEGARPDDSGKRRQPPTTAAARKVASYIWPRCFSVETLPHLPAAVLAVASQRARRAGTSPRALSAAALQQLVRGALPEATTLVQCQSDADRVVFARTALSRRVAAVTSDLDIALYGGVTMIRPRTGSSVTFDIVRPHVLLSLLRRFCAARKLLPSFVRAVSLDDAIAALRCYATVRSDSDWSNLSSAMTPNRSLTTMLTSDELQRSAALFSVHNSWIIRDDDELCLFTGNVAASMTLPELCKQVDAANCAWHSAAALVCVALTRVDFSCFFFSIWLCSCVKTRTHSLTH